MVKIIPADRIKHLEWNPEKDSTQQQAPIQHQPIIPRNTAVAFNSNGFSVDDLVNNGKYFYSDKQDKNGNWVGVPIAFQKALKYADANGIVASMPYLIAGKAQAEKENYLWQYWFTALTEENIGIDKKGIFARKAGDPVLVTVHGGGILTPKRISTAYKSGLTPQNAATYTDSEFDKLLQGVLPTGETIQIYNLEDLKKGISNPFDRYAVVMNFDDAKATKSGYFTKQEFIENPVVLARAGTLNYLDSYFEKAKKSDNETVGNHHRFSEVDPSVSQGRLLFLSNSYGGLVGDGNLSGKGRFVGVAPEAHVAKK